MNTKNTKNTNISKSIEESRVSYIVENLGTCLKIVEDYQK